MVVPLPTGFYVSAYLNDEDVQIILTQPYVLTLIVSHSLAKLEAILLTKHVHCDTPKKKVKHINN
jgi:hypothetical protein